MGTVYHVSATHGIRRFEPRLASRPLSVGPWESTPWFFAPPELKRIGVWLGANALIPEAAPQLPTSGRALVFEHRDSDRLVRHAFSIYEFDDRGFTRRHGDEDVAERAVEPLRETIYTNALARIRERGIAVAFVDDIEARYRSLQRLGAPFFLVRHIDGAIADVASAARIDA